MTLENLQLQKFLKHGLESFEDIEIVELLLSLKTDRRNYWSESIAIFRKYKTLREVLDAPQEELKTIRGFKEHYRLGLQLPQFVANRYLEQKIKEKPIMSNPKDVIKYLSHSMRGLEKEHFKVLYLNNKNMIIANEDHVKGTVNYVQPYTREILKNALKLNATSVILAHNHTSGDPTPSSDDIKFTEYVYCGARFLDIALHDHIIIGDNKYYSFEEKGIMEKLNEKIKKS